MPADPISQVLRSVFAFFSIDFTFRFLLVFIVSLFLVRAVALAMSSYIRGWITADFLYHESADTFQRLFASSWPYLLRQKLGTVHATLVRDIQRAGTLLGATSQAIQSFTGFLMYLLVALNISPLMTLYTLAGGGVLLLIVRPFLSRTRLVGEGMAGAEKQISQFIAEHTIGMKAVKTAGAENRALTSGNALLRALRALQIRLALVMSLSTSVFQPFTIIFIIVLFAVTYQLPGFSLISFAATLYLIQKIFTYLESGQGSLHTISELVPYVENLTTFKRELAEHIEPHEKKGNPFVFERAVEFKNVSFAYHDRTPVLEGVDFTVKKGTTAGLIGPSGAGKTSVADLLLRLFRPTGGSITLDGVDLESLDLAEWRRHIGYVSQDSFLLNGTVEENIRFYRSDLSRSAIEEAARQANIYDFVMSLPEGFATHVGDRGVMLSGGQRQRVALARALAGKPHLLVLDEATSALDQDSERLIQEAIRDLHGDVTVLIIAHRLSTVENADTVVVLERGRITERGSPEELLKNPDSYYTKHREHPSRRL